MTLHAAIEQLLKETGRQMSTQEIADILNRKKWYTKKDGSKITDFQIHGRTRNYPQIFNRTGSMVTLVSHSSAKVTKPKTDKKVPSKRSRVKINDEHYVLDICDKVLQTPSSRQHKFDFLLGDTNSKGIAARLPVDAYYEHLKLVIEYREKQHTENVDFFDKPNRMTVSGVHRGEQRKIYDERRRKLIPKNNLSLVEISYLDFKHDNQKRIIRNEKIDTDFIRKLLHSYIK